MPNLLLFGTSHGGRRVTGVLRGLQNRCLAQKAMDGFDSHLPPPQGKALHSVLSAELNSMIVYLIYTLLF